MAVYARGSFGFQPVVGFAPHYWPLRDHERLFMGLPPAGQHISGTFLVGGRRVVPIRHTQNELAVRFLLFDGPDGSDLELTDATGFSGVADVDSRDSRWGLFQPGRRPRFAFAAGENDALWRETDQFAVVGRPVGHGLQLAIPDAEEPFGYRARYWIVESGEADGQEVSGFFTHEQVYLRPGAGWFTSRYMGELEQVWISFFTVFEDGAIVQGHLCRGREGFAFAAIQPTDGEPIATATIDCDIEFDEAGYPRRAVFTLGDGSVWEYRTGTSGGRMVLPGDAPRWRDGVVTRGGETRDVAFGAAWAEAFPDRFVAPSGIVEP